jgi:hypothetical protein
LLNGYCSASLLVWTLPPPSPLRPTSRSHRLYGLPCSAAFTAGGGGFLQLLSASLSPCCRYHPAGVEYRVSQPTTLDAAFTLTVAGSASEATHFRGHLCVRLRCGPVTCSHPYDGVVDGLQVIGFPPPCHPSYEASGSCLGGTNSRKTRQPLLDAQPDVSLSTYPARATYRRLPPSAETNRVHPASS